MGSTTSLPRTNLIDFVTFRTRLSRRASRLVPKAFGRGAHVLNNRKTCPVALAYGANFLRLTGIGTAAFCV